MQGWWAVSYVVMWLLLAALTVVVVALARQIGTLHLRLGPRGALEVDDEGPPLGEAPPPEESTDAQGRPARIGGPGEPQLLLFVSPGCHLCEQVLPSLPAVADNVHAPARWSCGRSQLGGWRGCRNGCWRRRRSRSCI